MKALFYIMRLLYVGLVCYSTGIVTVILIHLMLGLNPSDIEPLYVFLATIIHLIILDVSFLQKKKSTIMPYAQSIGRAFRDNKKPMVTYIDVGDKEEHF